MIQVAILEDEDTILGTDFVRQLKLEYVGQSDVLLLENTYPLPRKAQCSLDAVI